MLVNEGLVARHVEDIAFLWTRRRAVLRANRLTHAERLALESRLDAHIEAASLAGETAQRSAIAALEFRRDPGIAFAAAVLTIVGGNESARQRTLEAVGWDEGALAALVSAIGWSTFADVDPILAGWSRAADERCLLLSIAGSSSHRRSAGDAVARGLRSARAAVRRAAAKAAGELGARQLTGSLTELLGDTDAGARFQAARALARFGDPCPAVRDVLLEVSESGGTLAERAVAALIHLVAEEGLSLFRRWAVAEPSRRLALVAAEILGSRDLIESLIPWMADDGIARSAGEAFRAITGADLVDHHLSRPRPAHVPGDPNDEPEDPCVELPVDYDAPFPSAAAVAAWWERSSAQYASGIRYLDGHPVGAHQRPFDAEHIDHLRTLAQCGRPRHRTIAAGALAQARPDRTTIETHAFASRGHLLPGWEAWMDGPTLDH